MNITSIYYLHETGGKKNQEDTIWPAPGTAVPQNKIFIVCDGVGGSKNGEVASRMIASYMGNYLLKTHPESISIDYVNNLLLAAKEKLIDYARTEKLNKDMATTFAMLYLFSNKAFIAWCGDSRVYHIRNGDILFQTGDHSLVNSLVKTGEITAAQALVHPKKNIILKAITGDDTISDAEGQWINDIDDGDYFLLCTDGLLENITEADLRTLLSVNNSGQKDMAAAMQEKCFGQTRDNYSMYLLQVSPQPETIRKKKPVKTSKQSKSVLWFGLIALAVVAAGLWYFYINYYEANARPAAAAPADSVVAPVNSNTKTDTVFQPGKSPVADSELVNKEEPPIKKILPAAIKKTKADSVGHKRKIPQKDSAAGTMRIQTPVANQVAAEKKDSSSKHG